MKTPWSLLTCSRICLITRLIQRSKGYQSFASQIVMKIIKHNIIIMMPRVMEMYQISMNIEGSQSLTEFTEILFQNGVPVRFGKRSKSITLCRLCKHSREGKHVTIGGACHHVMIVMSSIPMIYLHHMHLHWS